MGQSTLSELEREILLSAYAGSSHKRQSRGALSLKRWALSEWNRALTNLVFNDLFTWVGGDSYVLTAEGELTARMLMTDVTA